MEGTEMNARGNEKKSAIKGEQLGYVEIVISRLLRAGVLISLSTVAAGLLLMFVHHPSYLRSIIDLQRLTSPGAAFPHTLREVSSGLLAMRGQAVVVLGLLLLIATPIMRVAVSIAGFVLQRDRAFVVITSAVLAVLLVSFLLGKVG
jgi:uncharacterized membrane protein